MKTKLKIFLILLFIPVTMFGTNPATSTAGDSVATAIPLQLNYQMSGSVAAAGNTWYNVTISTIADYSFNLTADSATVFDLSVYNPQGNYLMSNYYSNSYPIVVALLLNPGTYSIQVYASQGSGNFVICAAKGAQGETLDNSIPLGLNTILAGNPFYDSYYVVNIPSTGYYKFNLTSDYTSNYYYYLMDGVGNQIATPNTYVYPESLVINLTTGTYYLNVQFYGGNTSFYISAFSYTIHQGEDLAHAILLPIGSAYTESIPYAVYFNVSIPAQQYYDFQLNAANTINLYFTVYDSFGNMIEGSPSSSYPLNLPLNLTVGNYYVQMYFYSSSGTFTFGVYPYTIHSGEDLANAIFLTQNINVTGNIPYNYYFNFTINTAGIYKFTFVTNNANNFYFDIYGQYYSWYGGGPSYQGYQIVNLPIGNFYLQVTSYSSTGQFQLSYFPYSPKPGEILQSAINLPMNAHQNGSLPVQTYYNFTINSTDNYLFQLVSSQYHYLGISLYYGDGWYIDSTYSSGSYPIWLSEALSPGSYYIVVSGDLTSYMITYGLSSQTSLITTTPTVPSGSTTTYYNGNPPTSQTSSSGPSITVSTPFSPLDIIFVSIGTIAVIGVFRRKNRNI